MGSEPKKFVKHIAARTHPIFKPSKDPTTIGASTHDSDRGAARRLFYGETNFSLLPYGEFSRTARRRYKTHQEFRIGQDDTVLPKDLTLAKLRKNRRSAKWVFGGGMRRYWRRVGQDLIWRESNFGRSFEALTAQFSGTGYANHNLWNALFVGGFAKQNSHIPADSSVPARL